MPVFVIILKATTVEGISTVAAASPATRSWGVNLRCTKCDTVTPSPCEIGPEASVELEGGGSAGAALKCKECKALLTGSVVPEGEYKKLVSTSVSSSASSSSSARQQQRFDRLGVPVAALDLRGCEPTALFLDDQWVLYGNPKESDDGSSGGGEEDDTDTDNNLFAPPDGVTEFPNADLSQDWADYDEATETSTLVGGVTAEFVRDAKLTAYLKGGGSK